jgi:hypothetical protein
MASIYADYNLYDKWDLEQLEIDPATIVSYELDDNNDLIVEYRDEHNQPYKVKYYATAQGADDMKWVCNNATLEADDWELAKQPTPRPKTEDDRLVEDEVAV